MKINPEIFKPYDIRGVYPKQINEKIAFEIGRAFVQFLKRKKRKKTKIIVGRDNRISSSSLARGLKQGIKTQNAQIVDIGLSTTPMLYFGINLLNADGGVMVSASHNPAEYNGFKLTREKAIPISENTGIQEIKKIIIQKSFKRSSSKGEEKKKRIMREYIRFNLSFLDQLKLSPLKIVIDTANAVSGILIKPLERRIKKIKIYHLFWKLDGRFPYHQPDPLKKENLKSLQKEVLKRKADLGVAFDGDGDRIIFVDEKGKVISGDLITALLARIILKKNPNEKILYDIRSSDVVKETIKENRGIPVESRIGHSFIKEKMRKENIAFGGELSGHYYLRENNFCEAPFFVLFKIMEEISVQNKPLSKIISPFKRYVSSGEINFKIKDKQKAMERLENYFKNKALQVSHLDGVKLKFKDHWILLRPSNTEPLLRLVIEAKNQKILNKKIKEVRKLI